MIELLAKEIIKPIVSSIVEYIKDDTKAQVYAENMQRLLTSNYKTRSGVKNILHSVTPVPFMDIYCPLKIKMLSSDFQCDYGSQPVESVKTLLNNVNNIAIFGNAGCGKSTLVNFLYLNAIEERYKYPILISLRYLNETNDTLVKYLRQQTLGYKEMDKVDTLFLNLLEDGRFLFFFDGYDEVTPTKQYSIANQIKELVSQYPNNKYVLTSRPLEQLYALKAFHNYVVAPLGNDDRDVFIKKQFPEDRQMIANTIIRKIHENPNNQYEQILNTPLLVILCILNFQLNSDLPVKRTAFYTRIFDALFQGHDWLSKTGYERDRKSKMNKDEYVEVLNKFASYTYFNAKYSFKKEEALNILYKILKIDSEYQWARESSVNNVFEDLTVAINILISDGSYYSFPHKSFQEYYVANYICSNDEEGRKKVYSIFVDKFFEEKGSLLSLSLLSMIYEMDQSLFINGFIIPALNKVKESTLNKIYDLKLERIETLLAVTNFLFYNQDQNSVRGLFANGKVENYLAEIDNLTEKADQILALQKRDDNFINSLMDLS